MSTHPNAILMCVITPHDLARKTMKAILEEYGGDDDHETKIGGEDYHHRVMEDSYDESWQISAEEGDLVFFDLVTYGYGDVIEWNKLAAQQKALEEWAIKVCEKHHAEYKIYVGANYW